MICWIESVDPVVDLCLTNQILYRIILFSAVECFEFKQITALKCCSKDVNSWFERLLKMAKRVFVVNCKTLTRC